MSSEVPSEAAFPRALWRVRVRVDVWEALGKAISAETEQHSVAE